MVERAGDGRGAGMLLIAVFDKISAVDRWPNMSPEWMIHVEEFE